MGLRAQVVPTRIPWSNRSEPRQSSSTVPSKNIWNSSKWPLTGLYHQFLVLLISYYSFLSILPVIFRLFSSFFVYHQIFTFFKVHSYFQHWKRFSFCIFCKGGGRNLFRKRGLSQKNQFTSATSFLLTSGDWIIFNISIYYYNHGQIHSIISP